MNAVKSTYIIKGLIVGALPLVAFWVGWANVPRPISADQERVNFERKDVKKHSLKKFPSPTPRPKTSSSANKSVFWERTFGKSGETRTASSLGVLF